MGNLVVWIIFVSSTLLVNIRARQLISKKVADNSTGICHEPFILNQPGFIKSPGFPTGYPDNLYCTWKVVAPEGQVIGVEFGAMDIEHEESCIYDTLVVKGNKYCGRTLPDDFVTERNAFEITFLSDERVSSPGFILYYDFSDACSSGYFYDQYLNTCYRIVDTPKTWDDARADCLSVPGGDLIQVTNKYVHYFASSITSSILLWLGARRYDPTDITNYVWAKTNTPVSDYETFWAADEPNNHKGNQECMVMEYVEHEPVQWWGDVACSATCNYICEHSI